MTAEERFNNKYALEYPLDCFKLDDQIAKMQSEIAELNTLKQAISLTSYQKTYLSLLKNATYDRRIMFSKLACVSTIEQTKLNESAQILEENYKLSDYDVLAKAQKERDLLLVMGGLVIIGGLILILR